MVRSLVTDYPVSFFRALSWQLFSGYFQLAFFPLILWLGNRYRFERGAWKRSLPVHLLARSRRNASVCCVYRGSGQHRRSQDGLAELPEDLVTAHPGVTLHPGPWPARTSASCLRTDSARR